MLLLTRKIGEEIVIGNGITVRVLGVKGGSASIGITAPKQIRIYREELLSNHSAEEQVDRRIQENHSSDNR